ncbi:hypothetical protein FIBSPDRAFT_1040988 [Athelia psychrophila]|uniref:Uncharacterized protein n=1 Tax=Athelia psychrophila TaxID=1759441 RepID=A0A166PKT9_9AGAM|nr:hypothetical protein FIBSPDRAFT_1040988 [Fibularhizoctonia sp. CBS 109695]
MGAGIPLPWLRTWIQHETFPEGWKLSRTTGLAEVARESGDGDEEMAEQWDSALSTALWDATPSTSEEEGGEHEK